MDIQNPGSLRSAADHALEPLGYLPNKLALICSGVTFLFSALLMFVSYLLQEQIGSTGGLGGIGTRSMLSTIQSVLRIAQIILLPLWEIGFTAAMLDIVRGRSVSHLTLLEGFRRFGPVIRLNLLRGAIYFALAVAVSYVTGFVYLSTPWGSEMMDKAMGLMNESMLSDPEAMAEVITSVFSDYMLPFLVIFAVLFLAVFLPVFYRLRMSDFALMSHPEKGALSALRESRRITRSRCVSLLRLDIGFWWYYGLQLLIGGLCYGDILAELAGISLPFSAGVSYFLFFFLSQIAAVCLCCWARSRVSAAYAVAFEAMQVPAEPKPVPKSVPWNY